ncbi:hypothetical protein ZOSMA_60G00330 [Zostera marina]|uniref:KAT8 regulatory NSL complex subunit 2 n=1 Tax=Zostera marina TaxID=29655 RepID=A0A0K9NTI5_ZOSMR|nr:hypothetical protein ZOSMA_60G00330 [Zostera marina]
MTSPPPSLLPSCPLSERASNESSSMLRPRPLQPSSTENPRNTTSRLKPTAYDSIPIDGSSEDELLRYSEALTREEVLRRRSRRLKQLSRISRNQYWALMEEVKLLHRKYYWKFGRSPMVKSSPDARKDGSEEMEITDKFPVCVFSGCKTKPMALTTYCFQHILSDQRQTLYRPCTYVIKSSAQSKPIACGKPYMRSTVPTYCSFHFDMAKNYLSQALKKSISNQTSSGRIAPKAHEVVYKLIQCAQHNRIILRSIENSGVE